MNIDNTNDYILKIVKFSECKARTFARALQFEHLIIESGEISQSTGSRRRICFSYDELLISDINGGLKEIW